MSKESRRSYTPITRRAIAAPLPPPCQSPAGHPCAGARRLAAVKALGETEIETRSAGRISDERLRAIELGENVEWEALKPSALH